MIIARIQSTTGKGAETQSTIEGQQHKVEKKDIQGVLLHSQKRRKKTSCKKHWKAALIAAHAYLLTTRPEPEDPREDMHQAAIRSLGIVEDKIRGKGPETKSTNYKGRRKEKFKHNITQNESCESSEEKR
jgi:hypothetical protein